MVPIERGDPRGHFDTKIGSGTGSINVSHAQKVAVALKKHSQFAMIHFAHIIISILFYT
jgi:hypothetical protein